MKNSTQNSAKALNLRLNSNENSRNLNNSLNLSPNSNKNSANSNKNSSSKTFWPYGILLALFAIVAACIATIIYSLDYPVYEDDAYLQKYQKVNNNFNKLQLQDAAFRQDFEVKLNLQPQFDKKNRPFYEIKSAQNLEFSVISKGDLNANIISKNDLKNDDIKPTLLLTRPHTNTQDKLLDFSQIKQNNASLFRIALPSLEKGRWQLKLRLEKDENSVGFYEFNLLVSE